jgi:hypothetical protein
MNFIYLIQEREFIKTGENIYKVGKTHQPNQTRISHYPKGSNLLLYAPCDDCDICERKVLLILRQKYINRTDIGREYFEGNKDTMTEDILTIIKQHNDINTDEENKITDWIIPIVGIGLMVGSGLKKLLKKQQ